MKNILACRLQPPLLIDARYWDKKRKKEGKNDSVNVIGANMSPFTFIIIIIIMAYNNGAIYGFLRPSYWNVDNQ